MLRTLLAASLFAGCLLAQSAEFEAAAIKPAPRQAIGRTSTRMSTDTDLGSLIYANVNVKDMMGRAFGVQQFQITGPSWMETERFDITATFQPHADVQRMLQALLADRFQLKIHRETKELPAYALTVAKSGLKMKSSESDGDLASNSNGKVWRITAKITMRRLAEILTEPAGRPVLDQTGLAGAYELALEWSTAEVADSSFPSIFTALQEQLGLKLEATKAPVEAIVIDHLEKAPSEN